MKLNGTQLKYIALFFMTLEHIGYFFSPHIPIVALQIITLLGRFVAPLFIFLAVEAYVHTIDKNKYIIRLFVAATLMFLGSLVISSLTSAVLPMNMFAALACGVVFIDSIKGVLQETELKKRIIYVTVVLASLFAATLLEGGLITPLLFCVFYFLRTERSKMILFYLFIVGLFAINIWVKLPFLHNFGSLQWGMILAIPFILLYNGQKGNTQKYFFYIYYPVHIWLLAFLGSLL